MHRHDFDEMYAGTPPWNIGRPQPAFQSLADGGRILGPVLDVGCGTGEHALMVSALGLEALGVDSSPVAVARAESKAAERGSNAKFLVSDALQLAGLGEQFRTVIDSGLFHGFDDDARARYVDGLRAAVEPGGRYFMLCFSDLVPPGFGPRRISRDEIRASFTEGWKVESIEPAAFEVTFTPAGIPGWLATITRT